MSELRKLRQILVQGRQVALPDLGGMNVPEVAADAVAGHVLLFLRPDLAGEIRPHQSVDHAFVGSRRPRIQAVFLDELLPGGHAVQVAFVAQVVVGELFVGQVLPARTTEPQHLGRQRIGPVQIAERQHHYPEAVLEDFLLGGSHLTGVVEPGEQRVDDGEEIHQPHPRDHRA